MEQEQSVETIPDTGTRRAASRARSRRRKWRLYPAVAVIAVIGALGLGILLYPSAASWLSAYNQSQLIDEFRAVEDTLSPSAREQLASAREYNRALSSGAILVADANVPSGTGSQTGTELEYRDQLVTPNEVMSRIQVPSVGIDLPIYHGTSDETLLRGAGHLEGTSLPVGGVDTHSVITAHRGLASASMFTPLDGVEVGDLFTVTTLGEVITYEVESTQVVDPSDTATLRQQPGRDLMTLITCTPLGVNSHRILVTGSRVTPTPPEMAEKASEAPGAGFPWWMVAGAGGLILIGGYVYVSGRRPPVAPKKKGGTADDGGSDLAPDQSPPGGSGASVSGPATALMNDDVYADTDDNSEPTGIEIFERQSL